MQLIKYLIPTVIASSIALGALAFGGKGDVVLDTRPVDIVDAVPLKEDGTYTQFEKNAWKPNTRVIEYKTDKDVGYQVLEYKLDVDGTYMRSYGEGPEAVERSFDWIKISDSATSTP